MKFSKPIHKKKTKKRLNKVRKTPMGTLERKAWTIFSRYIRLRDARKSGSVALDWLHCYTCGKAVLFKEAEAGHFIHDKNVVKFNEKVVHGQCSHCNHRLRGNLALYALHMIKDYGHPEVERLLAIKHQTHKFTREELEGIIKDSQKKIKELEAI